MTEKEKLLDLSETDKEQVKNLQKFSLGVIGALGYNISAIAGIACILLMNKPPPDFQLDTMRFSVGLIFASLFLVTKRKVPTVERKNIKWLCFIAAVTVSYNVALYSHYLKNLTFVGILSLQSCFAVIFISILSRIFLKTNIQLTKYLIITTTLVGLGLTIASQYTEFTKGTTKKSNDDAWNNVIYKPAKLETNNTVNETITSNFSNATQLIEEETSISTNYTDSQFGLQEDNPGTDYSTILISITILIVARFLGCTESITVAGTGIKDEDTVVLSLWYFIVGTVISAVAMTLFEHPFLPATISDLFLWLGHAVSASSVIYFDLLAVQNIDVNVYYITGTFKLPVSFLLQLTLLKNVTPNANMYLLVSGMIVVFLCSITMPVYEYLKLRRKDYDVQL